MNNVDTNTPFLNTANCPNEDETNGYLTRSEMLETSKILANAPRLKNRHFNPYLLHRKIFVILKNVTFLKNSGYKPLQK
jgi:hypothetical protein